MFQSFCVETVGIFGLSLDMGEDWDEWCGSGGVAVMWWCNGVAVQWCGCGLPWCGCAMVVWPAMVWWCNGVEVQWCAAVVWVSSEECSCVYSRVHLRDLNQQKNQSAAQYVFRVSHQLWQI